MTAVSPLVLVLLAVLGGTGVDAMVKALGQELPILTLTAWRFLIGSVIFLPTYIWRGGRWPSGRAIRFHTLRGVVQSGAIFTFFLALTMLPLAMVTTLGFTAALMVAPMARLVLSERITRVVYLAAVVGFGGAALVASGFPSDPEVTANRTLGVALVLVSAALYALTLVLIRLSARDDPPLTIMMYSNVVPGIVIGGALLVAHPVAGIQLAPSLDQFPFLLGLALTGMTVWTLMTVAYSRAAAGRLAPLEYTALIWSAAMGWAFFGEVPGWRLWAGAAIIIAACLMVAVEDRFRSRKAARQPASDLPA